MGILLLKHQPWDIDEGKKHKGRSSLFALIKNEMTPAGWYMGYWNRKRQIGGQNYERNDTDPYHKNEKEIWGFPIFSVFSPLEVSD